MGSTDLTVAVARIQRFAAIFLITCGLSLDGCGGGGGSSSGSGSSPNPQTFDLDFRIDKSAIELGDSVTITWNATMAQDCSGRWSLADLSLPVSGSRTFRNITVDTEYTLFCFGANSQSINKSVRVTVRSMSAAQTLQSESGRYSFSYRAQLLRITSLAWDPTRQLIFATTDEPTGFAGRILALDPHTGDVRYSLNLDMRATSLAISPDGQFVYAVIDGNQGIRRLRASDLSRDIDIAIGHGEATVVGIAISPQAPQTIAVAARNVDSLNDEVVMIYDNAARRPAVLNSPQYIRGGYWGWRPAAIGWADDGAALYLTDNYASGIATLDVAANGLSFASLDDTLYARTNFSRQGQIFYTSNGYKYDFSSKMILGQMSGHDNTENVLGLVPTSNRAVGTQDDVIIDPGTGLPRSDGVRINTYSMSSLARLDTVVIKGYGPGRSSGLFITWGTRGVAFSDRTHLVIGEGSLIDGPSPVYGLTPDVALSGTVNSQLGALSYRKVAIGSDDVVLNHCNGFLEITTSGTSPFEPASIVEIDPTSLRAQRVLRVGREPERIALSRDCQYLYTAHARSNSVTRSKTSNFSVDATIPVPIGEYVFTKYGSGYGGAVAAENIAVDPNVSTTFAVTKRQALPIAFCGNIWFGVQVFDGATPRPVTYGEPIASVQDIAWPLSSTLYGTGQGAEILKMNLDSTGIASTELLGNTGIWSGAMLHYDSHLNRLYNGAGLVFDLPTGHDLNSVHGNLQGGIAGASCRTAEDVTTDASTGRVYYAFADTDGMHIESYDPLTFDRKDAALLPLSVVGFDAPLRLVRWGTDGLAVVTDAGWLILLQGPLARGS